MLLCYACKIIAIDQFECVLEEKREQRKKCTLLKVKRKTTCSIDFSEESMDVIKTILDTTFLFSYICDWNEVQCVHCSCSLNKYFSWNGERYVKSLVKGQAFLFGFMPFLTHLYEQDKMNKMTILNAMFVQKSCTFSLLLMHTKALKTARS